MSGFLIVLLLVHQNKRITVSRRGGRELTLIETPFSKHFLPARFRFCSFFSEKKTNKSITMESARKYKLSPGAPAAQCFSQHRQETADDGS